MSLLDATAALCEMIIEIGWAALWLGVVWYGVRFVVELLRASWRVR